MKKLSLLLFVIILLSLGACTPKVDVKAEKAEVEAVLKKWIEGIENFDSAALSELFALDSQFVNWGVLVDEDYIGWDSYGKHVEETGKIISEQTVTMKEMQIMISKSGDVAWFNHIRDYLGIFTNGEEAKFDGVRVTGVLEKADNKWLIVHFHHSLEYGAN